METLLGRMIYLRVLMLPWCEDGKAMNNLMVAQLGRLANLTSLSIHCDGFLETVLMPLLLALCQDSSCVCA